MGLRSVSLPELLRRNAAIFGERTAFVCQGTRVSHRDHLRRVERLAAVSRQFTRSRMAPSQAAAP
jgi:acyl-CoA synthetase (AMP-forming)/AMP-acid ligase II